MAMVWMKKDGARPTSQSAQGLSLVGDRAEPEVKQHEPRTDLLATIEQQIIPRLVLAHTPDPAAKAECPDARLPPTTEEVAQFAELATAQDLPTLLAFIEHMCREGLTLDSVLLDLVAPAARLLGSQWEDDRRNFTEVTAGLGAIQQAVQVLGPSSAPTLAHRGLVVLVAAPNEQHTLGIYLVGEFLRRGGWGVHLDPNMSKDELVALVSSERVEMVGISVSNPELLRSLSSLIAAVKTASCNPELAVLLGGSATLKDFAEKNGAHVCSSQDPRDAVLWLEQHVKSSRS